MRAGFGPGVLFPHLSYAGKEAEFHSALSLEKSFAPVQCVGSPAKLQGEVAAMPNGPCRFLIKQSHLGTFFLLPIVSIQLIRNGCFAAFESGFSQAQMHTHLQVLRAELTRGAKAQRSLQMHTGKQLLVELKKR